MTFSASCTEPNPLPGRCSNRSGLLHVLPEHFNLTAGAILLDVDGTLLDIAPTPHAVRVPGLLKKALVRLTERTGGALAFVSGRSLADLDLIFDPLKLSAIAGHGAEIRLTTNGEHEVRLSGELDEELRRRLTGVANLGSGIVVEDKGYAIALHYRLAPEHEVTVHEAVAEICADVPASAVELLPGKAVLEIKPRAFTKGTAVRELMHLPPFRGRVPLFIGDDVTDETVFEILPEFSGIGFSVGRRIPGLAGTFCSPGEVRRWLYDLALLEGDDL